MPGDKQRLKAKRKSKELLKGLTYQVGGLKVLRSNISLAENIW